MQASVEISMYPLTKDYEAPILDFIKRLNQYPELVVETNRLSTQVFGVYDHLMEVVSKEIKTSFLQDNTVVMVMKILNVRPD